MKQLRDTRQRLEQWVKNPQCEANTVSAVKGISMSRVENKKALQICTLFPPLP